MPPWRPARYTLSVFVCMLDYSGPARAKGLRNSVLFLGHRFPNVRKTTAEALYLKLLANEDIVDEVHGEGWNRHVMKRARVCVPFFLFFL